MKTITTQIFPFLLMCFFCSFGYSQVLFTEHFDYSPGALPSNWTIDADESADWIPNWSINESQQAGGVTPELLLMYYSGPFPETQVGVSRLLSPAINVEAHKNLSVRFKQYLINYQGGNGDEVIGVEVTFDNGNSWQALWQDQLGFLNIPQDEYVYFVVAPEEATEMQVAFRYEGDNQNLNFWAIDDLVVENATDSDLLVSDFSGSPTPISGQNFTYTVEVSNGGQTTQDEYVVEIKDENDNTIASANGNSIEFGEKQIYQLNWQPEDSYIGEHQFYAEVTSSADDEEENNRSRLFTVNILPSNVESVDLALGDWPTQHNVPFNFFVLDNLSQTIYLADEIGVEEGTINGIMYTAYFDNDINEVPIQLFLAQTDKTDLADALLTPYAFTPVFDGLVNFQRGLNSVFIPFDNSYEYGGGNLVVYTNRSYPEQVLWSILFIGLNQGFDELPRSREVDSYEGPIDPMNPEPGFPQFFVPNISLFFETEDLSVIAPDPVEVGIILYPNPATDIIQFQTSESVEIKAVSLYDISGRLVKSKENTSAVLQNLEVGELENGVYLLQLNTSKGVFSKKVIITH